MTQTVETEIEGCMGIIRLNRPQAINALDAAMVAAIAAALRRWADDGQVAAVLFEGNGPRGFCSGGDVRAARAAVLDGRPEEAEAFFAAEYEMNRLVSSYGKPVIVLAHGAVMGGGIGIAGHADFRFVAADVRYAMPEGAIGFFPDVGVNWLLARAPLHRGVLFELLGAPVGAADALELGLADGAIAPGAMADVRSELLVAATAPDPAAAVVGVMQSHAIEPGPAEFCLMADRVAALAEGVTAEAVLAAIEAAAEYDAELQPVARMLRTRSPTTQEVALQSLRAARHAQGMDEVLARDLRLARWVVAQPDFAEGVRAVLIDRDGPPAWQPSCVDAARRADIARLIAGD